MKFFKENKLNGQEGQAIFELIIFVPFFLYLISVLITLGNSINGAINQQKAVRAYFFGTYRGNPTMPSKNNLEAFQRNAVESVGLIGFGWRMKRVGGDGSEAGCFKLPSVIGNDPHKDENCEDTGPPKDSTGFIRLYTMFGVCSQNYIVDGATYKVDHFTKGSAACTNR
jgi:hypothetical protein